MPQQLAIYNEIDIQQNEIKLVNRRVNRQHTHTQVNRETGIHTRTHAPNSFDQTEREKRECQSDHDAATTMRVLSNY